MLKEQAGSHFEVIENRVQLAERQGVALNSTYADYPRILFHAAKETAKAKKPLK